MNNSILTKQNNKMNERISKGFTLIELMVVLLIIGILAGVGYPRYISHLQNTQRAVAQSTLVSLSAAMEIYYSENNTYTGAALPTIFPNQVPIQGNEVTHHLSLSIDDDGGSYILIATPTDTSLKVLQLSSSGLKKHGSEIGW